MRANNMTTTMPNTTELNQTVPDFELPATSGTNFKLSSYQGKHLVIYFYPKDNTPGCTTQGMQFRDSYNEFQAANTEIFGVSRDSLKSHENFKAKFTFPFELLADTEELACGIFSVMRMKNMYGKQVRGIERSTFIIDKNGVLVREWRGVKVDGHAAEVLQFIKTL
jgi:thioredoxin-dependent peroxiredoxin